MPPAPRRYSVTQNRYFQNFVCSVNQNTKEDARGHPSNDASESQGSRNQKTVGYDTEKPESGDNDRKIGCRLDYGNIIKEEGRTVRRFQLQLNAGARNPTLKALANKDTHAIWSYADIPLYEKPETESEEEKTEREEEKTEREEEKTEREEEKTEREEEKTV
ncbi:hypothetical protein E4U49_005182 [Claviceps purpurea]|nr:hypothetical protein E4U49_005182 [Claviceps purpurea]